MSESLETIPTAVLPIGADNDLPVSSWLEYKPSARSTQETINRRSGDGYAHPEPASWQPVFLDALSREANISRAAETAGILASLPYYYKKVDPSFARAWAAAYEQGMDGFEGVLQDHARNNSKAAVVATIFLLKGRRRHIYGDKTEVSGPGGGAIPVSHMLTTMTESLQRMKNITPVEVAPAFISNDEAPGIGPGTPESTLEPRQSDTTPETVEASTPAPVQGESETS